MRTRNKVYKSKWSILIHLVHQIKKCLSPFHLLGVNINGV
jgi:hypothetical protein